MPTLTIQLPGLPPVDHILREEMMTIGRMKGNTIALDDASVSVSHAKITRKGTEFYLKDLNSTNGTMLNGQSINEARLKDGDQLKFGEVIALYHSEPEFVSATPGATPAAAPALPPAPAPVPALALAPAPTVLPSAPVTAPQPVIAAATFVSKRLVTQAAQKAVTVSPPKPAGHTTQHTRGRQQKPAWPVPVVGGAVGLVALAVILMKVFMGGEPAPKPPANANPPTVSAPAKSNPPNSQPGNVGSRPAPPAPKNSVAAAVPAKSPADLKNALKAADPAERRRAAKALHGLGSGAKEALPELRSALNDSDPDVRMWSALALINNKSYDKGAIPILIQVLQNDNSMLRQVSCLSLALIPYEDAEKEKVVGALSEAANKDEDEEVRKAAVSALKIIAPEAVAAGK